MYMYMSLHYIEYSYMCEYDYLVSVEVEGQVGAGGFIFGEQ